MLPRFEPMRLARRPQPFDHADWIYEIKFDGFRALAYLENETCRLVSRRRNEYKAFRNLCSSIAGSLASVTDAVIDGEIVCLDPDGRSNFNDLMFRRGEPFFYAFDLLWLNSEDLRELPLTERKSRLRDVCSAGDSEGSRLLYLDHLEQNGTGLFARACEFDLEGIVAKWKNGRYRADPKRSSWTKIRNPQYSQWAGREDLFQRSGK